MCRTFVSRVLIARALVVALGCGLLSWSRLDGPSVALADVVEIEASRDNTLFEHVAGALSNGAGDSLFAGTTNSGQIRRGLIAFDLASSIPAGAVIVSVTLKLRMSRTVSVGPDTIDLHRVDSDWGEGSSNSAIRGGGGGAPSTTGDATWVHRFFNTDEWTTRGGDFSGLSAAASVGSIGSYTWGSTPGMVLDVQTWLDEPASNFGWLLKARDEGTPRSAKRFDSRESPSASNRPSLSVEFTPPVAEPLFRRGDTNNDGVLDVSDAVGVLEAFFLSGDVLPCEDAADVNDDSVLDISDVVGILLELFGSIVIPDPGSSACGIDPTEDDLGCSGYTADCT